MIRTFVAALTIGLVCSACSLTGLEFTNDRRVAWVTEDRSTVSLPLTLDWEAPGFEVTGADGQSSPDGGYFAVFVDRTPQGRDEPLSVLAEDDEVCVEDPNCPDATWFAERQVYVVEDGTSLTLEQLPGGGDDEVEFHDFTLVLLDGQGRRQGESSHRIRLIVEREA